MEKLDLKKKYKHLYLPARKEASLVDVPEFQFAMIDGRVEAGEAPDESGAFHDALTALYGISYGLKFMSRQRAENPIDYTVMALEGLWWVENGRFDFNKVQPWYFRLMMMQPEHIGEADYLQALEDLKQKKPNPALEKMQFVSFHEGLSVQILHVGPYTEEPRSLAKMQAFADEHGYLYRGDHHEIYLGDPRRAKPENLRTVLRHPVEKAG